MNPAVFRKWCVFILMVTGVLWFTGAVLSYLAVRLGTGTAFTGQAMSLARAIFMVFALLAVYHFDIEQEGRTGFFAFVLAMIGTIIGVIPEYLILSSTGGSGGAALELARIEVLRNSGAVIYLAGYIWFGVVIFFNGSLSRWGALALTMGIVLATLPALFHKAPDLTTLLGALSGVIGLTWLGLSLLRIRDREPPPSQE